MCKKHLFLESINKMFIHFDKSKSYAISELQDILYIIKNDVSKLEDRIKSVLKGNGICYQNIIVDVLVMLKTEQCSIYKYFEESTNKNV